MEAFIWLEYRASIALWVVGIIMPALDIWLYWSHGLYGDAGMAFYYTLAAFYGFYVWKFKKTRKLKQELPIIHTVPVLDSFTNALSFIGLWALARKYLEQWLFWMVVDVVCCMLYVQKGIPFKAGLYGLYVLIAIAGYYKWKKMTKITKYERV